MINREDQETLSLGNSDQSSASHGVPAKAFVIYVVAFFVFWSLRATVLIRIDEGIESGVWRNVYSSGVKFLTWVLPVFVALVVWRIPPFRYLKLTTPPNRRGLLVGAIVALVWFSLVVLGEALVSHRNAWAMLTNRLAEWPSILARVAFSSIFEEVLFRGFFLNRLSESLTFWKANLIAGFLFMLAHWPYWVSKFGFSAQVIKDSVNVFLLGCLFGWLMKKANSLWPAIAAHIANNFLSALIHS